MTSSLRFISEPQISLENYSDRFNFEKSFRTQIVIRKIFIKITFNGQKIYLGEREIGMA